MLAPCLIDHQMILNHLILISRLAVIERYFTFIFILELDGRHIGLNDKLFGAMGTNKIVLTPLRTTGPPADNAYAVEPVGEDTKIPSPEVVVIY